MFGENIQIKKYARLLKKSEEEYTIRTSQNNNELPVDIGTINLIGQEPFS